MRPESGVSSPPSRWSRVVLPHPEGPITATHSPPSTASEMSLSTFVFAVRWLALSLRRNDLQRLLATIASMWSTVKITPSRVCRLPSDRGPSTHPPADGHAVPPRGRRRRNRRPISVHQVRFVRDDGWRPPRVDIVIAALATAFCISGAAIDGAMAGEPNITVLAVLVLLLQCVPLVWRSRHPVIVCAVTGAAAGLYGAVDWPDPLLPLGAFIALATVVELCSRRTAIIVWLIAAISMPVTIMSIPDSDAVDAWVGVVVIVFAPLLGEWQRSRR